MVLVAAVGLALWWQSDDRAPGVPVASVAGATLERGPADPGLAESLQRSVRSVRASGCGIDRQATVTLVDGDDGPTGLTNQHVVAGSSDLVVDGVQDRVDLAGHVDGRDAAIVDGDDLADGGLEPLESGPRPIVGAQVVVAGYPGGVFEATVGHVRAVEVRQGYGGSGDVMLIDVAATPGVSGGVVVDSDGRAVGLVAARDPSTGEVVAYPLDELDGPVQDTTTPCS